MTEHFSDPLSNGVLKHLTSEDHKMKIDEMRKIIGPLLSSSSTYCSDDMISRHLRAQSWNVKKAIKMMKETLKWRATYQPEKITWDDIADEAETGKIYMSNVVDKYGRTVLVMRPSCQNSTSTKAQVRYLVYCMETAIFHLPPGQEQMVWLIDFKGFNKSQISFGVTKESASVLQNYYPERLGAAILYDPPKIFESFWRGVKHFLDPETCKKVNFVYANDTRTAKIMTELFDIALLEPAFGGKGLPGFDKHVYSEKMRESDKKRKEFWSRLAPMPQVPPDPVDFCILNPDPVLEESST